MTEDAGTAAARLLNRLAALSEPGPGVTRLPFTEQHREAAALIEQRMRQAGLETRRLSAGQRRRLAIGRLLTGGHRVWILDEPFTALDTDGIALLTALLEQAMDDDLGLVFTSHSARQVVQAVGRRATG